MLLTFLYHRVGSEKYANPLSMLEKNFSYLAKHYPIVTPEQKLSKWRLNICLSFDDAYYDFYHYVFPLLKKYNLRAVLGVPVKYIQEKTDLCPKKRLDISYKKAMNNTIYEKYVPFCTWEELREMVNSGYVHVASHSYSHTNLLKSDDLDLELVQSKAILEKKLCTKITTFIFPFGKFNPEILQLAKNHYQTVMRIGSALNFSWQNFSGITYRLTSDNLYCKKQLFRFQKWPFYFWFFFLNTLRRR